MVVVEGVRYIGFTGTRHGMSENQKQSLLGFLFWEHQLGVPLWGVNGGCVGSDAEFHQICILNDIKTIIRPGHSTRNPGDMRFRADLVADKVHDPKPYLARNRDIVHMCDVLVACPYDDSGKGGTWYAINYAKKIGRNFVILER